MFAVRIIISIALATVVVLIITAVGMNIYGAFDDQTTGSRKLHDVELLSESRRRDLAEELGLATRPKRPELPALEDIPAFELPRRGISGFVQVEVAVDSDGRVTDAHVVDATPPGVYEQQALEQIRQKRFTPDYVNGQPIPGTRLEIVDFTVPAAQNDNL